MRIQYCSDLHLEKEENNQLYKNKKLIVPSGEILVILGDLLELQNGSYDLPLFDELSKNFQMVFWIPGNHEYRGGFDTSLIEDFNFMYAVRPNIFLVNNQVIIYKGVKLVFSTLWSHISKHTAMIEKEVPDYELCFYRGQVLTPFDTNYFYEKSVRFLKNTIDHKSDYKTILCTHYPPSKRCDSPEFENHYLNEAFYSELDALILASDIDYWLYGHTHYNQNDFYIGNTLMSTNQLGYVRQQLATIQEPNGKCEFKFFKTIDI